MRISPRSFFPARSYVAVACSSPLLRFIPPATPTVIFLRYYCMFQSSSTFHIATTPDRHPPTLLLHVPFPFYVSYLQQPRPLSSYVTIACSNPLLRFISPLPPTAILLRRCCMFHSPSTFHTSSNPDRYLPTLLLHVQILFYVSYQHYPRPPSSYDAVACSIPLLLRFITVSLSLPFRAHLLLPLIHSCRTSGSDYLNRIVAFRWCRESHPQELIW
jgi:hypothetical protein